MPGLVNGTSPAVKAISTTTKVCAWGLHPDEHTEPRPPRDAEALYSVAPSIEAVIDTDQRVRVPQADFLPGGKYRCKLKIRKSNGKARHGSSNRTTVQPS